jgi:hypothetical protein
VILRKKGGAIEQDADLPVRFVPMIRGRGDAPEPLEATPEAAGDPSP